MKTGFIGLGKMGSALLLGMLRSGAVEPENVWVCDRHPENIRAVQSQFPGVHEAATEAAVAGNVDVLVLAVKPKGIRPLLGRLHEALSYWPLTISIAAAVKLADMEALAPSARIIRTMPNTPCMVQSGVIAYSPGEKATPQDEETVRALFFGCGVTLKVAEADMNAVSAISGCGPAYMYTALDALADAGVAMGLTRTAALQLAAATMAGSAQMLMATGQHPMALRDAVTSPGGTTIAGMNALDECGFRHAWISAVKAAVVRAKEMEG